MPNEYIVSDDALLAILIADHGVDDAAAALAAGTIDPQVYIDAMNTYTATLLSEDDIDWTMLDLQG